MVGCSVLFISLVGEILLVGSVGVSNIYIFLP